MRFDNEKGICDKCGKKIPLKIFNDTDIHDGGCYEYSYNKIDMNFGKRVGFDFYGS